MYEVILKRFDQPDETRTFEKGKFELVHVGGLTTAGPATCPAGNGPFMSAKPSGRTAVKLNMLAWLSPDELQPRWTMVESSK